MKFLKLFILFCFTFVFPLRVFAANPPDQSHSTFSVSGSTPADGSSQITITVVLLDSSNNPVVGDNVTISDTSNSNALINTTSGTTNSNGQTTYTITSTAPSTDNINVTDTTANVTFSNFGQVVFTSVSTPTPTPVGYCSDTTPGTPTITSAVPASRTSITITWTDPASPVSYYQISYGNTSGNYIYGNPNIGGQGTTFYTVSSLSPGKTYYFVVKAVNGCSPGLYSNEIASSSYVSPTTAPSPTDVPTSAPSPTPEALAPIPEDTATPIPTKTPSKSFAEKITIPEILVVSTILVIAIIGFALHQTKRQSS